MAPILAPMREEVATQAETADVGMVKHMDNAEDNMGFIELVASR